MTVSMRVMSAGDGYKYLLRTVAAADGDRSLSTPLTRYYVEAGTPPGQWLGSGVASLGKGRLAVGDRVSEAQLQLLMGMGRDPITGDPLGLAFPAYKSPAERIEARIVDLSPALRPGAKAAAVAQIEAEERQRGTRRAVAGFDFTFSIPKSASALWAVADAGTQALIGEAHHRAVAEVVAFMEREVAATRTGATAGDGAVAQVDVTGLVATAFDHFDSRAGDPHLHTHVVISNKVQTAFDGKWRSLDGRPMHAAVVALSELHQAVFADHMTRTFGVEWESRDMGRDRNPSWAISSVPEQLVQEFSTRSRHIDAEKGRLIAEYVAKHGHQPAQRAGYALWQKAILDTRDAKKPAESLSEHRRNWRESAVRVVGEVAVDRLLDDVRAAGPESHARPVFDPAEHADTVAAEAIRAVTGKRAQFRASHVDTAVSVALKGYRFTSDDHRRHAHDVALRAAMTGHAVRLTPGELLDLPSALTAANGAAIDRRANAEVYTTRGVLEAEKSVLDAAGEPVTVFATDTGVDAALARHQEANGWSLNDGQTALARHLANSGTLVAAGVGPAGTGKTASMKVVVDTWQSTGRNVHGLAPSAAAASVLAEETGADSHTIDSLVFTWRGHHPTKPGGDPAALPVTINPGDMLLVDEAGMASTDQLAALTEIAEQTGAVVRLVGDPSQLSAVAGGGIFAEVCQTPGTPELRQVMRMGSDTEQAEATVDEPRVSAWERTQRPLRRPLRRDIPWGRFAG